MAYIAVNNTDDFVRLDINADGEDYTANVAAAFDGTGSANAYSVPSLQEITVNATPGLFRWQQLDSLSERVVTVPSSNSINMTLVLDDTTFYDGSNASPGIFDISNDKVRVYFRLYWAGDSTGDRYLEGSGFISGLAPTVSTGSPVYTSPVTIEVDGDFGQDTVA